MKTRRFLWLIALLVASLALVAAACGGDDDEEAGEPTTEEPTVGALGAVEIAPGEPIKIAALQSLSGATASLGTDQVRGIEIAIEDFGEINGHSVELQSEDDGCSAEAGTTGAQRIVADPQVVGIIGTSCSGAGVPASQIMSEAGLVMISGSNTSPSLTSDLEGNANDAFQPGYLRTAHNDLIQGQAAAEFVFNELGLTKIATIHDGDPYTEGLATAMGNAFTGLGGEVVLATAVNKGDTDMRPVLTEVAASGAELVYFPIFQPEADFIAKQARDIAGLKAATMMAADGVLSDTFVTIPATEGMYFSGPAQPASPAYEEFVQKYEDKYGEKPIQAFHAHTYDATTLLLTKIQEIAVDRDGTLVIDREALREAMYTIAGFDGLTGTLTCDEFGDCAAPKINILRNTEEEKTIDEVQKNVLFTFEP
ncbi:MAG: branched-chain amino acid ABC transporter substrate-binding protein [Gaiellaceae bacterium]